MNFRNIGHRTALAAALILVLAGGAAAAPADTWIGAWGFVPTPLPPGITPAAGQTQPDVAPLAPEVSVKPIAPPVSHPLLIDNPGNLPVEAAPARDPSNITVRQLVRVAVAGKRLRLRLTNEGGSDVLVLGAVHVGVAGPDGSVVAGTDHVVTFERPVVKAFADRLVVIAVTETGGSVVNQDAGDPGVRALAE